ncbi:dephospho-CoA kinase [Encephalitozoon hellem ATCC 50504]|uniref:Dephospho-CoA kinase n=1 Tax=Encephalitozoon hellem TaxID=27973 RepID=A0A9Q9C815_ENCHE|nr:dephospho-CoA kinase [Encephalitozoon hellem ATCC 50504]AFM99289.1 dephospho-CoA kinase [Encephalitozoon hellem ATCC 50504]UTX44292.1 dephospho-CoA kinase [Encephalitozoon hellem]|eukprot:XP_003888270.1 dephospho-CoA kinase [Encephalitozoon hellem ATCC 50504]
MRIIAITGGIGMGKTALLNILEAKGHATINTDDLVHEILGGEDISSLRQRFFTDTKFRKAHEKRIRPKLYAKMAKRIICLLLAGHSVIFIEIPLLFELDLHHYFYTIVVACDKNLQIERGGKITYFKERLALQIPIERKVELAQKVIYNNGDIDNLIDSASNICFSGSSIYCCLLIISTVILLMVCE